MTASPLPETALILPVPDAEPVVGRWRRGHDPSAAQGVPGHITLLYPFRAPDELDDRIDADLERLFGASAPIRLTLAGICGFRNVLYLTPEAPEPREITVCDLMTVRRTQLPVHGPWRGNALQRAQERAGGPSQDRDRAGVAHVASLDAKTGARNRAATAICTGLTAPRARRV